MKYNKENYEASALDYIENNLSAEDRAEFEVFLLLNPEIQESISEFELIEVPALVGMRYPDKKALLKDEGNGRVIFFNQKMISRVAAILLLLVAVIYFLPKTEAPEMATTETKTIMEPEPVVEEGKLETEELAAVTTSPKVQEKVIKTEVVKLPRVVNAPTTHEILDETLVTNDIAETPVYEDIDLLQDASQVPLEELLKVDDRVVHQVAKIEQIMASSITHKEYALEELDFPVLVIDEEELLGKEPSKFKRFLARANLIPSDFTSDDYDSFKENLLPESIPGLK